MNGPRPQLRAIALSLWVVDGVDLVLPGRIYFPLRMTIVQTQPGELLLYSPVALDDEMTRQISDLGKVVHIVAPNTFHTLFANAARQRFPGATLWASDATRKKHKNLQVDAVVTENMPNPFGGATRCLQVPSKFGELTLFHDVSASLIVCDLVFNIAPKNWITGLVLSAVGCNNTLGQSRFWRRAVRDRTQTRQATERIVSQPYTRLIPAHGTIVDDNAVPRLREAMSWMLDPTKG
jgi:Domain of unknown function (DUF4336)